MKALSIFIVIQALFLSPSLRAESLASYPVGWESWTVVKETMNYPADTVLPADASLFFQQTVQAYSWINDGQGSPVTIRVNPEKLDEFFTQGPYSDGPTAVAFTELPGILWVTEHIGGEAIYGSYNIKGEDISHSHLTLKPSYCQSCHSTYKDICVNGICTDLDRVGVK